MFNWRKEITAQSTVDSVCGCTVQFLGLTFIFGIAPAVIILLGLIIDLRLSDLLGDLGL